MLKDEFTTEETLKKRLDEYTVVIPKEKLSMKQTRWQRFIRYVASPTKDPLETIHTTSTGLKLFRTIPLASAVFITAIQLLLQF
ncbi:hypothetical protein H1Z61_02215 [Bacillus aquiflavi]|uniref:Uncharacterized protein n=1 Tax=Bacillus aquiflavi TaxID=2672567 RepID=A0A6B3VXV2_9BACI|nr:hypothetical protein [Bacillus aquiflavi]MBA4535981.1 hypothetical protein [Bacillus aquiflavi]NEY80356.1 hypothetical protein [Bacillus aquiflavi]UAC47727.1 hypothetical protein K6959_14030 [Bacillus aquiflavi]